MKNLNCKILFLALIITGCNYDNKDNVNSKEFLPTSINYDFDNLEFKEVEWFGSYQLVEMIQHDAHLFNGLKKNGFLQMRSMSG